MCYPLVQSPGVIGGGGRANRMHDINAFVPVYGGGERRSPCSDDKIKGKTSLGYFYMVW